MTLRRYSVTVVRQERQEVTFTADDQDVENADMRHAVAHAYAKDEQWVRDSGFQISGLSQVPIVPETSKDHDPDRDPLHVAPHRHSQSDTP
jgi:hypothetical protein